MAYLTKEQYNYRRESAAQRMADNAEIETLTPEQHEILAELCALRHWLHSEVRPISFYYTSHSDYDTLTELTSDLTGEERNFAKIIEETGIDFDLTNLRNIISDLSVMDTDGYTEELSEDDDERKEQIEEIISEYGRLQENINTEIEKFLAQVDKEYGTNYCPTGALRIF